MGISNETRRVISLLVLVSIPLSLLGFFFLLRGEFRDIGQVRTLVDRSVERRATLSSLLVEHLDVETGQRGYLLTGQQEFLEPYEAGRDHIAADFRALDREVQSAPEYAEDVARLKALSAKKMAFVEASLAQARTGDLAGARRLVAEGTGKRLMDAIRSQVERLDRAEEQRLSATIAIRDFSRARIERTIYLVLAAFSLLLALVGMVTARAVRGRAIQLSRADELAARFRAVINGTADGLLLLDEQGNIRGTNPSIARLFGYDEEDLVGRHNTFLMSDPPPLADSMRWLRRVGAAGRDGAGGRQEFTGRRKDGSIFETDVTISQIAPGSGYVAIVRDVTHRKRIEAMKSEFVSTVSHELRTPLTSIGGALGLISSGAVGPVGEKAARLVQIAYNNCERLVRLINDILDIEKIEAGKMRFDMRHMRVTPLIDRVVASNSQFAAGRGVTLEARHPAWPLVIEGDDDRLEQLLTNLVSNAIKYSPAGGTVEIVAHEQGRNVRLDVCDRGTGIPEEFRSRIFGKFAMADSSDSRARGGTGLGLSIAQEIARRHNGEISFADRAGGGTVFSVDLPLVCETGSEEESDPSRSLPAVLHLDDDHDCLHIVASAFKGRADVVSAATLEEAREAAALRQFAAAIIDVGVAPHSGLALVPLLRTMQPSIKLVLFTAIDEPHSGVDLDAVLVKSRSPVEELVATTMRLTQDPEG
jgi:PAS domain S-box-containing protein